MTWRNSTCESMEIPDLDPQDPAPWLLSRRRRRRRLSSRRRRPWRPVESETSRLFGRSQENRSVMKFPCYQREIHWNPSVWTVDPTPRRSRLRRLRRLLLLKCSSHSSCCGPWRKLSKQLINRWFHGDILGLMVINSIYSGDILGRNDDIVRI